MLMSEGLPIEGHPSFRFFPVLSIHKVLNAYTSYASSLADGVSWVDFARELTHSLYFECSVGWFIISDLRPGLSAWLHGGSFDPSDRGKNLLVKENRSLLRFIMKDQNLGSINCRTPEHNVNAAGWLRAMGFELMGVIPFDGTWQGKPGNRSLFALFRSEGEGGE